MKRIAIVQSSYIPWKGYFDLVKRVDEFILLDDVQFTRRDWRNRNKIKTSKGPLWLTIPVKSKGRYLQTIAETEVSDRDWPKRHWRSITQWYARAACFPEFAHRFEELFLDCSAALLSDVNHRFIVGICEMLGIGTTIRRSSELVIVPGKTERLVSLCEQVEATTYLSGPAARAYLDEGSFASRGIAVEWMDYSRYPEYRQLYPPFDHHVSILDLILNEGAAASKYMQSL